MHHKAEGDGYRNGLNACYVGNLKKKYGYALYFDWGWCGFCVKVGKRLRVSVEIQLFTPNYAYHWSAPHYLKPFKVKRYRDG